MTYDEIDRRLPPSLHCVTVQGFFGRRSRCASTTAKDASATLSRCPCKECAVDWCEFYGYQFVDNDELRNSHSNRLYHLGNGNTSSMRVVPTLGNPATWLDMVVPQATATQRTSSNVPRNLPCLFEKVRCGMA